MQSRHRSALLEAAGLEIGPKVRDLRLARRWTQAELAARLGLSQARLSEIERGNGSFTAEQFLEILRLFNVHTSHFAAERAQPPDAELQNALARLGATHLREPAFAFADCPARAAGAQLSSDRSETSASARSRPVAR